jgi:hypothetical protein
VAWAVTAGVLTSPAAEANKPGLHRPVRLLRSLTATVTATSPVSGEQILYPTKSIGPALSIDVSVEALLHWSIADGLRLVQ